MNGFVDIVNGFSQVDIDELVIDADNLYLNNWTVDDTQTMSTLAFAVSNVSEPTKFILSDEIYNGTIVLDGNAHSVWIIAENSMGVTLNGTTTFSGNNITFENFLMTGTGEGVDGILDGGINVHGNDIRITRCRFDDLKRRNYLVAEDTAERLEISYCDFLNKNNNLDAGVSPGTPLRLYASKGVDSKSHNHHIHHNLFQNIPEGVNGNGYECIHPYCHEDDDAGLNDSWNVPEATDHGMLIEYNLFDNVNGEGELISIKANTISFNYNTINANSSGSVSIRHARDCTVHGNTIYDSTIRANAYGHTITNNFLVDQVTNEGIFLVGGLAGTATPTYNYRQTETTLIDGNLISNCEKGVLRFAEELYVGDLAPITTTVSNNTFIQGSATHLVQIGNAPNEVDDMTFSGNEYVGTLDGRLSTGWTEVPIGTIDMNPPTTTGTPILTTADVGVDA